MKAVTVMGREYRIRGDVDEGHLDRVSLHLDEVLRQVQETTADTHDATVLAALNLASEVLRLRQAREAADERLRSLIDRLGSA